MRDYSASKFADQTGTYLKKAKDSQKVHLDRNHQYYYQVQLQMRCTGRRWCDFYVVFSQDTFLETIYYDEGSMTNWLLKAKICYERIIFSLLKTKKDNEEIENTVSQVLSDLLDRCEIVDFDDIDFDEVIYDLEESK